jgi:hypothetical protein
MQWSVVPQQTGRTRLSLWRRLPFLKFDAYGYKGSIVDPIALSVVFVVGFAVVYRVRKRKSRMRHRSYYHADSAD